ncbi:hypothetical protein E3T34_13600 [Cryobacterium sp. TMT1-62]|uniref:Integral membrane protein n=1 Tax=Cryobacterium sandaracinum TaxID=1259247 RepID=A0ABY2JLZ4_9MICO|nr:MULTISPECIES: hypothetical protein [Cryobacterium]TFB57326.1 hypothetical protein E3N94_05720 [Cryobacterium sp. Sr3]TFB64632.1 hypothetical protein E3N86_03110 [Cryobacterium sp. Hz7]TFC34062.1 hypothetical protein E3O28_12705 [Cryobacterium sp. TMT2-14]TFC51365.1 hypothetical protein E3O47_06315 [Cryobacterium sp. TMT2-17-1]TFC69613.1 hypothetical protein E3O54_04890 [Cryobacterium sp. TMT2-4]
MTAEQSNAAGTPAESARSTPVTGIGRVLIAVYGLLALAATGRSFVQIASKFAEAPLSYSLSALAAVVYIVATVALIRSGGRWRRVAWITIGFEFAGVLVVGTLSLVDPALFPHDSVWSLYGRGYLFIPLVLPVLGMWWLSRSGKVRE